MSLLFVELSGFTRTWKQSRLNDDDLRALQGVLMANPSAGPVMAGTGGVRKV